MTLVKTRAAFEKAVTDALSDFDPTISMVYDNVTYTSAGKNNRYVTMTMNFAQSTIQSQGSAISYYSGVIQCNIYVPKSKGTNDLSNIAEIVINGLTSVNNASYVDSFQIQPRVQDINGPSMLEIEDRSHFVGVISCQFSTNA